MKNFDVKDLCEIKLPYNSNSNNKRYLSNNNNEGYSTIILNDIGEGIAEVEIKEWFVKPGDKIKEFDPICEVKSDKASVTITSRYDGIIKEIYGESGDIIKVGTVIANIQDDNKIQKNNQDENKKTANKIADNKITENQHKFNESFSFKGDDKNFVKVSPLVRKYANENKINLSLVQTHFPNKNLTIDDIKIFIANDNQSNIPNESKSSVRGLEPNNEDVVVPWTANRITMFKTMKAALEIPHLVYSDDINITELLKTIKIKNSEKNINIFSCLIKSISESIKLNQMINSWLVKSKDNADKIHDGYKLIKKTSHNFGIAIDTGDKGLCVGVIKNVQDLKIVDIFNETKRLKQLALMDKLTEKDISNPTFTISNIGSIGGTYFKPLILAPQVAIIALGKSRKCVDDQILLPISIAADHRVIDGATVARFSQHLKKSLENNENYLL